MNIYYPTNIKCIEIGNSPSRTIRLRLADGYMREYGAVLREDKFGTITAELEEVYGGWTEIKECNKESDCKGCYYKGYCKTSQNKE